MRVLVRDSFVLRSYHDHVTVLIVLMKLREDPLGHLRIKVWDHMFADIWYLKLDYSCSKGIQNEMFCFWSCLIIICIIYQVFLFQYFIIFLT